MPGRLSRPARPSRGKPFVGPKPTTSSITSFARVSKVQSVSKEVADKVSCIEFGKAPSIEIVLSSRKRKADNSQDAPQTGSTPKRLRQETIPATKPIAALKKRKALTNDDKENVVPVKPTAAKQLLPAATLPLSAASSSRNNQKRARSPDRDSEPAALLERLNLQSSPVRKRTRFTTTTTRTNTPEQLPEELLDLLSLHTALLKSLTIHYAHNGSNVPVDIRTICPNVASSWGKRKVTSDDIQRCVGVLGWTSSSTTAATSPFILTDYGRGKLCIELTSESGSAHFNESQLSTLFESNLRLLWSARRDSDITTFIPTLPKATISNRATAIPLLSKGRNALDLLKSDLVKKQAAKETPSSAVPVLNADGSKMSLLDRIRHKQTVLQSQSSTTLSAAELQRRAALQRAEDVAGVIGMLTVATAEGRARISFTMAALLIKLRDSLRTPVSQEEGAVCVRLLAQEVAPGWLRVVTIGGRENVVVQCGMQPSKGWVGERVRELLG